MYIPATETEMARNNNRVAALMAEYINATRLLSEDESREHYGTRGVELIINRLDEFGVDATNIVHTMEYAQLGEMDYDC